jgi:hypothetical protein
MTELTQRSENDSIDSVVAEWPGVDVESHRFNGREFTLGAREIGHIHGERLLDIPFAKRIRDILIETDQADEHHVVPESGWISFRIVGDADRTHAIWLLKLSYLYNVAVLKSQGAADEDLDAVDLDSEVSEMKLGGELDAVFDPLRAS